MDWTVLLTAISAIGAAGVASAAAWQAFETREQVTESRNQGEMDGNLSPRHPRRIGDLREVEITP